MCLSGRADKFKEQRLLPDILTDLFCNVFGYTRPADNVARFAHQLARHSTITLSMDRYSHARLVDLNAAVTNLPSLRPESKTARLTETAETAIRIPCAVYSTGPKLALKIDKKGLFVRSDEEVRLSREYARK